MEQRTAIKMCVHTHKCFKDTYRDLKHAWGDHTLSVTQCQMWFKYFDMDPEKTTKDGAHTGCKKSQRTPKRIEELRIQVDQDHRQTVRQLSTATNMSHTSVCHILRKDLGMKKLTPCLIPRLLTDQQKASRLRLSTHNLTSLCNDPSLFQRIIATDESWVYTFDPCSKKSDMQWRTSQKKRPVKAQRSHSRGCAMLILYFDWQGVVLADFVDAGTVTAKVYVASLRCFQEAVCWKRAERWQTQDFILLQDNAWAHTTDLKVDYIDSVNMDTWPHPPYSPDLSPCDYFAFPKLQEYIRGHTFHSIADLQTGVWRALDNIPKADFTTCFRCLAFHYQRCIDFRGNYFEGQGKRVYCLLAYCCMKIILQ